MSTAAASSVTPATSVPRGSCTEEAPEGERERMVVTGALATVVGPPASQRLFYGWLMIPLATLVMLASAPGQTYGFAFFNPSLRASLSLSQTELSATYLLATLFAAAPMWYLGGLTDRFGLKRSVLASVLAMAAACLFASTVQSAVTLFIACVVMRMVGAGMMGLLANNTLAAWFDRRLGFACGVMQLCMAGAFALVPAGMMGLIGAVGWRSAYAVLGVALAAGVLPLLWFAYREHPRDVGQFADGRHLGVFGRTREPVPVFEDGATCVVDPDAVRAKSMTLPEAAGTAIFWLLLVATAVWSLIGTGLIFHLESLLGGRGLSTSQIAWATPLMAAAMATTQLGGGLLADRMSVRTLLTAALGCIAAGSAVLACVDGAGALVAYGIHGVGQGLMTVITGASWARCFGPLHLGRIRGASATAAIAASALGSLVMGVSADRLGGFEASLWLFAAMAGAVAIAGAAGGMRSRAAVSQAGA